MIKKYVLIFGLLILINNCTLASTKIRLNNNKTIKQSNPNVESVSEIGSFDEENPLQNKQVLLVDMRKMESTEPDNISKSESNVILKYLFGNNSEVASTATVLRRVQGSFTKNGVDETLYFIRGGYDESAAGRYDIQSTSWIVVYQVTTAVFKKKINSQDLVKITDINNDGINEFLLSDGFTGTGETSLTITLHQIINNRLKELIAASYSDTCYDDNNLTEAEVIYYIPNRKSKTFPKFISEYYTRKCNSNGLWKKLKKNPFK